MCNQGHVVEPTRNRRRLAPCLAVWGAIAVAGCGDAEAECRFVPKKTSHAPASPASDQLFDRTFLHDVVLELAPSDLPSLSGTTGPLDKPDRVPVMVRFDHIETTGQIRLKGLSTYVGIDDRASFSIKFEGDNRLASMKKIVLNSTLHDSTLVRAPVAYALAAKIGLAAPRAAYARVTLNGELMGLYNVIEPINKQFLAAHFGEEQAWGNLYEASDFSLLAPGGPGSKPPDLKDEDEGRCRGDLEELQNALGSATSEQFVDALDARVDVDQLLRLVALENVIVRTDGFSDARNNFYLYRPPTPQSRWVMLPWGMDTLLASADRDPWELRGSDSGPDLASPLVHRMAQASELVARYRPVVDEAAEAFEASVVESELERVSSFFESEVVERPLSARLQAEARDFAEQAPLLRQIVRSRAAYLQAGRP